MDVLDVLLQDKSTKKNIIWATDTYEEFGEEFTDKMQMDVHSLLLCPDLIRPRIQKSQDAQAQRTRKKAEVFTPAWMCNLMNNLCDTDWFGRSGIFNVENGDHTWTVIEDGVKFPKGKTWQQYVDSRRLEITCGEAPYLISRYRIDSFLMRGKIKSDQLFYGWPSVDGIYFIVCHMEQVRPLPSDSQSQIRKQ